MFNSMTMFAAKQKMNSMFGGAAAEPVDNSKSQKMRDELAAKRQERDAAGGSKNKADKPKLSEMWAQNKAKNAK